MLADLADVPAVPIAGAVIGIDPSLRGNAFCLVPTTGPRIERRFSSDPGTSVRRRVERYKKLVRPIARAVDANAVRVAFVEGYAFSKADGRAFDRAEYRGVLYLALVKRGVTVVEVGPHLVKLFAADAGNADKSDVKAGLEARYGHEPFGPSKASEDSADAFALAMLGMCALGRLPCETAGQRQAVIQVVKLVREAAA